jgi:hypothetical protein
MAKIYDSGIVGLNELLRDLRGLGKEAQKELRQSSKTIAEQHMVPAWKNAALQYAGPWGEDIADSVRAGADRVPKIMIGNQKKTMKGGATPNMVRSPSNSGRRGKSFAPFERTNWISKTRSYQPAALEEWAKAVDRLIVKWQVM